MLDEPEQAAVLATVLVAAGKLPVLMGLSGVRPQPVAQRAQQLLAQPLTAQDAASSRAAALRLPAGWLLAPPAYVKPSPAGIVAHFHTVADATPLPIVASAHVATAGFVQLQRWLAVGQLAEARQLWHRLQPITGACFAEPNPAVIKAVLARQGWLHNTLRAPMGTASADSEAALLAALAAFNRP